MRVALLYGVWSGIKVNFSHDKSGLLIPVKMEGVFLSLVPNLLCACC